MAGIVAESLFADKLDPSVRKRLHKAMHTACLGNAKREGDWHGDDMWPSYSNVSASTGVSSPISLGTCDASALLLSATSLAIKNWLQCRR